MAAVVALAIGRGMRKLLEVVAKHAPADKVIDAIYRFVVSRREREPQQQPRRQPKQDSGEEPRPEPAPASAEEIVNTELPSCSDAPAPAIDVDDVVLEAPVPASAEEIVDLAVPSCSDAPAPAIDVDDVVLEADSPWPLVAVVCVAAGASIVVAYLEAAGEARRLAAVTGLRHALPPVAPATADRAVAHSTAAAAAVGPIFSGLLGRDSHLFPPPPPSAPPHDLPLIGFILVMALAMIPCSH